MNEFAAKNTTSQIVGEHQAEDWLELYNADDVVLSLDGYYLSDDPDDLMKYAVSTPHTRRISELTSLGEQVL